MNTYPLKNKISASYSYAEIREMLGKITKTPWSRGRLLLTPVTRKWSKEKIEVGDAEERQRIFSGFSPSDEGRSRKLICHVMWEDAEANAAFIAAAPAIIEQLLGEVETGRGFAEQGIIDEAIRVDRAELRKKVEGMHISQGGYPIIGHVFLDTGSYNSALSDVLSMLGE